MVHSCFLAIDLTCLHISDDNIILDFTVIYIWAFIAIHEALMTQVGPLTTAGQEVNLPKFVVSPTIRKLEIRKKNHPDFQKSFDIR